MEHAIRHEINVRVEENPAFYQSLRERLEEIIEQQRLERLDAAKQLSLLNRYCQVDVERANLSRRADFLCSHRTAQVTSCQTMKARSRSSR